MKAFLCGNSKAGCLLYTLVCSLSMTPVVNLPAFSQSSNPSALDERIAELRAFRARLHSEDEIERAAAFEFGIGSRDPDVQSITLKEAFRSRKRDLRSLALRHWFSTHSSMIVQLTMPDRASEATVTGWILEGGQRITAQRRFGPSCMFEVRSMTSR